MFPVAVLKLSHIESVEVGKEERMGRGALLRGNWGFQIWNLSCQLLYWKLTTTHPHWMRRRVRPGCERKAAYLGIWLRVGRAAEFDTSDHRFPSDSLRDYWFLRFWGKKCSYLCLPLADEKLEEKIFSARWKHHRLLQVWTGMYAAMT